MKRYFFIGIPILIIIGLGSYWVGWWRSVAYYSIASAIAHSQFDILEADALRKNNTPEALKWVETDLYGNNITLDAYQNKVPKDFRIAYTRVSSSIQRYKNENRSDLQFSNMVRRLKVTHPPVLKTKSPS